MSFKQKSLTESIKDSTAEIFTNDHDVLTELDNFARGLIGDDDLKERMIYLRSCAEMNARKLVDGSDSEERRNQEGDDRRGADRDGAA